MNQFLDNNKSTLQVLITSNSQDAMNDEILTKIAQIEESKLEVLDISYCKMVTDEGLKAFEGKFHPIKRLTMSGLMEVSGKVLFHIIDSCK